MKKESSYPVYSEALNQCAAILKVFKVDIDINDVRSSSRLADVVLQRALIVFILKKRKLSLVKIGSIINRDHASVIYLLNSYSKSSIADPRYEVIISKLSSDEFDVFIDKAELRDSINYHENKKKELLNHYNSKYGIF